MCDNRRSPLVWTFRTSADSRLCAQCPSEEVPGTNVPAGPPAANQASLFCKGRRSAILGHFGSPAPKLASLAAGHTQTVGCSPQATAFDSVINIQGGGEQGESRAHIVIIPFHLPASPPRLRSWRRALRDGHL
jgi:hypothetical protein